MPCLDVSAFVHLLLHGEILSLFRQRMESYMCDYWASSTPVNSERWLEHCAAIQQIPQDGSTSVYKFIKHVNDLKDYLSLDASDSMVLLLGLIPSNWIPRPEFVGWTTLRPSAFINCLKSDDEAAIWSMMNYLVYILYNKSLRTCRDFYSEADVSWQMRHLIKLNPADAFLPSFIYPFL